MTFVSPKVLASWTPTIHPGDPNMIQIDFDSFGFEAFVASTYCKLARNKCRLKCMSPNKKEPSWNTIVGPQSLLVVFYLQL